MNDALETSNQGSVDFIREGIKIGMLNGILALIILFVSYYMGFNVFAQTQFIAKFVPYMATILLLYGLQLKKKNHGFLSLKQGLQYTFTSYLIAALFTGVGNYILFVVIDKDLTQKLFDYGLQKSNLEPQKEKQVTTLKNIILGEGLFLIWDFVKSLLITLAIRKEKPQPAF